MNIKTTSLTPEILNIVAAKRTESPFSGEYNDQDTPGTYLCRQCGMALFRAPSKFHSSCGWPSFDAEIAGIVKKKTDSDGLRTEILCAQCNAHLGHIFHGEGFTSSNLRYCVNSLSLDFVADVQVEETEEGIFAAGCFWGVEYYFKKLKGVLKTQVGYTGGHTDHPTYREVCSHRTGHAEAIRVVYDPKKLNYQTLVKYFFEIHDPTQVNGQGPDVGGQYRSAIFYYDENQQQIAKELMTQLQNKGYQIATQLMPVNVFWPAETDHQDYYQKTGQQPYCHAYTQRFE